MQSYLKHSFCLFITTAVLLGCGACASHKKVKTVKAKNVILMIGDGMGVAQVYAALTAKKGELNMAAFPITGFSKTNSSDNYITDSAAGATALSTGQKTYNSAVGMDNAARPRETILETAQKNGFATGLVATSELQHATPASFAAHQPFRYKYEEISLDLTQSRPQLMIGGGYKYFTQRKDGRNLIDSLTAHNYTVVRDLKTAQNTAVLPLAVIASDTAMPKMQQGRGNYLPDATALSLKLLSRAGRKGFFVMIEGSQIDWGGHANESDYIIAEAVDFDNAVGEALAFAKKDGNTLVIVTADHETGGYTLNGGNLKTGEVEGRFTSGKHTGVMVPVFAYGPGAEQFSGVYHNTEIYFKMMAALQLDVPEEPAGQN